MNPELTKKTDEQVNELVEEVKAEIERDLIDISPEVPVGTQLSFDIEESTGRLMYNGKGTGTYRSKEDAIRAKLGEDKFALWLASKERANLSGAELERRNAALATETELLAKKNGGLAIGFVQTHSRDHGADAVFAALEKKLRVEACGRGKLFLVALDEHGHIMQGYELKPGQKPRFLFWTRFKTAVRVAWVAFTGALAGSQVSL